MLDLDQRGRSRNAPSRGACDIGADDTGGSPPPAISSIAPASVAPGEKATFTVTGTGFSSDAKLTGPQGVTFSAVTVGGEGTTITATIKVGSKAAAGSGLPVTVKDGELGGGESATDDDLTIT